MTFSDGLRNLPQQLRSQRLVDGIIDATAQLLVAAGPGVLSTNAVAEAAGISVGSLYRYFPNKDALVAAVVEREGRRFHDRIRARVGKPGCVALPDLLDRIVSTTMGAYRSVGEHDVLGAIELRRAGLFDRRAGALTAIIGELREAQPIAENPRLIDAAPIVAEIIVALIEAAANRPSPALSFDTVKTIAMAAALGYFSAADPHSIPPTTAAMLHQSSSIFQDH